MADESQPGPSAFVFCLSIYLKKLWVGGNVYVMRAEIRDRLSEKVPLAVIAAIPKENPSVPIPPVDHRCWLTLRTPDGEFTMQVPENVACNYKSRYGRAPGFPKWFLERVRDLLNVS